MEWIVEPIRIEPNDTCITYACGNKNEPCLAKNICIVNMCVQRCYYYY